MPDTSLEDDAVSVVSYVWKVIAGLVCLAAAIYAIMIAWHVNANHGTVLRIVIAIAAYFLWPFYLIMELVRGNLAGGQWKSIPMTYF